MCQILLQLATLLGCFDKRIRRIRKTGTVCIRNICDKLGKIWYNFKMETPLNLLGLKSEADDTNLRLKIPIIINNKHIATVVEASDTDQNTDTDATPYQEMRLSDFDFTSNEEVSGTDVDLTPLNEVPSKEIDFKPAVEELQQTSEEPMDCAEAVTVPAIDFFIERNVVELARSSWRGSSRNQRYLKGCLWSPDGTCLLTTVNGDGMHVFEMPRDLYSVDSVSPERPLDCLQSAVHIKEGGIVYDYCWFPFMNSSDPATCW